MEVRPFPRLFTACVAFGGNPGSMWRASVYARVSDSLQGHRASAQRSEKFFRVYAFSMGN